MLMLRFPMAGVCGMPVPGTKVEPHLQDHVIPVTDHQEGLAVLDHVSLDAGEGRERPLLHQVLLSPQGLRGLQCCHPTAPP